MDLAKEPNVTLTSTHLEVETAERVKLEKELVQLKKEREVLLGNAESLELELLYSKTGKIYWSSKDDVKNSIYKEIYKQALREVELARRQLDKQHEQDFDQLVSLKKQLEKKLSDAYEEVEEQKQIVIQWKKKVQKLITEGDDLRLLLEEQNSRNSFLEKKHRKFNSEFQLLNDELRQEKGLKERITREKEMILAEKYALEKNINALRVEFELKEQKLNNVMQEVQEITFSSPTEEDVAQLKKGKHQLENKVKVQVEELDDLASQIRMLEQAKLRLEGNTERIRNEHKKELQQKDEEFEELRSNNYKKMKTLEGQLETEHEERTQLLKEKHNAERRLAEAEERCRNSMSTSVNSNQKLKRDLKKTKALLRDIQMTAELNRDENSHKVVIRQLRNQLEDAEYARGSALKGRQVAETEAAENAACLEETLRIKNDLEDRLTVSSRECSQLQSQLEENEEELSELLKKYRSTITTLAVAQATEQEQLVIISQLEAEKISLQDHISELTSRLENIETMNNTGTTLTVKMLQIKNKELESKLELEEVTRSRLEIQITRLKDNIEKLQEEVACTRNRENSAQEMIRKINRNLGDSKEEHQLLLSRDAEHNIKYQELEKRLTASENEALALKEDLKLAMQRIESLQSALEKDVEDAGSESDIESRSCSKESIGTYMVNRNVHVSSISRCSLDSYRSAEKNLSDVQSKKANDFDTKNSSV